MADFIVNFVEFNKGVDFRVIFGLIIAYVLILWAIIVLWVYFDARKRYKSELYPFVMGLATFFLGIPFLVFYLLIRPDHEEVGGYESDYYLEPQKGGVNVPMINFVGEQGVEMTLNLTISPKVKNANPSDLKIDLNIEPNDTKFVVEEIKEVNKMIEETDILNRDAKKIGKPGLFSGLRNSLFGFKKQLSKKAEQKNAVRESVDIAKMLEEKNDRLDKKKKKKKHKRR